MRICCSEADRSTDGPCYCYAHASLPYSFLILSCAKSAALCSGAVGAVLTCPALAVSARTRIAERAFHEDNLCLAFPVLYLHQTS
jgi:hypothetical protein